MTKHWENQPLYIARKDKNYYKNVFSCKAFDEILRKPDKPIIYGKVILINTSPCVSLAVSFLPTLLIIQCL